MTARLAAPRCKTSHVRQAVASIVMTSCLACCTQPAIFCNVLLFPAATQSMIVFMDLQVVKNAMAVEDVIKGEWHGEF